MRPPHRYVFLGPVSYEFSFSPWDLRPAVRFSLEQETVKGYCDIEKLHIEGKTLEMKRVMIIKKNPTLLPSTLDWSCLSERLSSLALGLDEFELLIPSIQFISLIDRKKEKP